MDMLKIFFEISEEDTSAYFSDKKIWKCGQKYRDYQGKYPVIFISFKDIKHKNWEDSLRNIASVLAGEFLRHKELYESTKVNEFDKEYYRRVAAQKADEVELGQSLLILSRMTGILRIAKESIFSGLNNLKINSIWQYGYIQSMVCELLLYKWM